MAGGEASGRRFADLSKALLSGKDLNSPDMDSVVPAAWSRKSQPGFTSDMEKGQQQNLLRRPKLSDSEILNKLRSMSLARRPDIARKKKFLMRLAMVLHSYGSSATRTEFLVELAAKRLEVDVHIAVFPSVILIAFNQHQGNDLGGQEMHLLTTSQDLDVDKLGRADELANRVGAEEEGIEFLVAFWRLSSISSAPPTFSPHIRLLAFVLMSSAAAPLFFGGSLMDALVSGVLGFISGLLELWAAKNCIAASCIEFVASVIIACLARLTLLYVHPPICFFSTSLASLVWFLPGLSLTLGVNELIGKTYVSGSSRITAAIFSALQIGFGVAMGVNLIFWNTSKIEGDCQPPGLPTWLKLVWLLMYMAGSNILLNARRDQWIGMSLVAAVGYVVSEFTSGPFGVDASSVISAFAVGATGTVYARIFNHLPLAMKTSGILVLVPGGIGVKGVLSMIQQDVVSGLGFVFDMLIVGLSITLGLLLSKIVLFDEFLETVRKFHTSRSVVRKLLEEDREEVEQQAQEDEGKSSHGGGGRGEGSNDGESSPNRVGGSHKEVAREPEQEYMAF